jgi:hypothetical protein
MRTQVPKEMCARAFVCETEEGGGGRDLEKGVRDLFQGILLLSLPYVNIQRSRAVS